MSEPGCPALARFTRTARPLGLLLVAAFMGCAAQVPAPAARTLAAKVDAEAAPTRAISDFPALRRCMDNLLVDYGTRDVTVAVDELVNKSQRTDAGTRDLLVAAVSDITQRSRAIRLLASDPQRQPATVRPQYTLRGSILPLDNAGARPGGVLGLDLTLLSTEDSSVVPGTASRNTVSLAEGSAGAEGRAELHKFGTRFSLPSGGSLGQAPALRAVADVASIELFGRLAKVPYWTCFGASLADAAVAAEVQDWYDTMAARPADIIGYFQQQLRTRRLYDGPIDGTVNAPLKEAVARYREALGLSREPKLSLDFFQAYLGADHRALANRVTPAAVAIASPVSVSSVPLALRIAAANDAQRFARGESVQLTIKPSRDAFVYCFHQDENRKITRFFPNRFQRDSRVPSRTGLQLPGAMRFEIAMNARGQPETVACFGTETDVLAQLPTELNAGDFSPLPVASMDQLRTAFLKVTNGTLAQDSFQIRARN